MLIDSIPEWLPKDAWAGWIEMRKKMRNVPLTERAIRLTLNELERLRMQGYDPAQVLDQSTQRGWRGVFPVHGQQPVLMDRHGNRYRITAEGSRELIH